MTLPMSGLTVRWSLAGCPAGVADELVDYVSGTSYARFEQLPDLSFKTWRMRRDDWFEGCYVFVDSAARSAFQESFTATAAESPGSRIVAVAEGGGSFRSTPAWEH